MSATIRPETTISATRARLQADIARMSAALATGVAAGRFTRQGSYDHRARVLRQTEAKLAALAG